MGSLMFVSCVGGNEIIKNRKPTTICQLIVGRTNILGSSGTNTSLSTRGFEDQLKQLQDKSRKFREFICFMSQFELYNGRLKKNMVSFFITRLCSSCIMVD